MNIQMTNLPVNDAIEPPKGMTLVGYVDGSIGGADQLAALSSLFPHVRFRSVGSTWPNPPPAGLTALIISAADDEVDAVVRRLSARQEGAPVIVALTTSDPNSSRRLLQAGAADILLTPISEAALALSLERIFAQHAASGVDRAQPGKVVGLLKAGGGVGATSIGTQMAIMLANRAEGDLGVCFADLDVQFGLGALYLDLAETMTLTDVLDGGGALEDAPLGSALAKHRSGLRLLAAPRDLTPLEVVSPNQITGLVSALRREFSVTLLDLPTVWTAWTNQALQLCDQIVLFTHLSVPHSILTKKQLRVLALQHLDTISFTMVCNRFGGEQRSIISQKDAEKAIGRNFDVLLPEDRAVMNDALAQGCEISAIRAGTKLEKAIGQLADLISPQQADRPQTTETKRRWLFS